MVAILAGCAVLPSEESTSHASTDYVIVGSHASINNQFTWHGHSLGIYLLLNQVNDVRLNLQQCMGRYGPRTTPLRLETALRVRIQGILCSRTGLSSSLGVFFRWEVARGS